MNDKLTDLQARKEAAYNAGSPRSVERQHEKGKLLARDNGCAWALERNVDGDASKANFLRNQVDREVVDA